MNDETLEKAWRAGMDHFLNGSAATHDALATAAMRAALAALPLSGEAEMVGYIASQIAGEVGANCCFTTGGWKEPEKGHCECRSCARNILATLRPLLAAQIAAAVEKAEHTAEAWRRTSEAVHKLNAKLYNILEEPTLKGCSDLAIIAQLRMDERATYFRAAHETKARNEELESQITAAIAEERERCAKIARRCFICGEGSNSIAAAIRACPAPGDVV